MDEGRSTSTSKGGKRERREKTRREEGAERRGVWVREGRYRKRRQTERNGEKTERVNSQEG
ncbi:unnamed protein product [Gulo gulo]|uniref:Uncharacterized protein n=1 Tax=Gulo gulo TaxID=48420 RepID=A0A9X9LT35_GULGU|nr:unnamed protein product [Gulo gulo]